jgi:hypothetical protein
MIATTTTPTVQEQASAVLAHAAGYASHRTIAIGLRSGLLKALAASEHATPEELAERMDLDPFYVSVWCRSAYAAGICDRDAGRYRLAAHMATLLLDATSPAYAGGVFNVLEQHEMFGRFEASLASGRAALVGPDQPRMDRRGRRHWHPLLHPPGPRRAPAGSGAARTAGGRRHGGR